MLAQFFHWLTGYACIRVAGDTGRFFNIAVRSGILLWGFGKQGEASTAYVRAADYKKLRSIRTRCKGKLTCLKKAGLPLYMYRLLRRKGLLVGAAAGVAFYCFLSSFVWGVSVSGTTVLTDRQVLEAARSNGVYEGSAKSDFQAKEAANGILASLSDVSWVAVNTDGCFVEVVVTEREKKPDITDEAQLSNIVASREGIIVAIEAQRGRPEVSLGDVVEKGQLLISGIYGQEVDPYGPQPTDPAVTIGPARGKVVAETYREFAVEIPLRQTVLPEHGKRQTLLRLELFGVTIPLGFYTGPAENCRVFTEKERLSVLGRTLPVSICREIRETVVPVDCLLSEEQAKEQALLKLREMQKAVLPQGSRLEEENLTYTFTEESCFLSASGRYREPIGQNQEITVVSPEEMVENQENTANSPME